MTNKTNLLQKIRKNRNHSCRQAAKIAGVSYTTISRIENGKASPNLRTLNKLSDYYGLTIEKMIEVAEQIRYQEAKQNESDKISVGA